MKRILALLFTTVVLGLPSAAQPAASHQHGYLVGPQMQPRRVAQLVYATGIHDTYELTRSIAVMLAESQGYVHAYNDNFDANGKLLSRDVGLFQINLPASQVGTQAEQDLYDPVTNVEAMKKLHDARGWQPWVAYTSGVYLHDGYVHRASLAAMNLVAERLVLDARALGQSPSTSIPMVSQKQLASLGLCLYC